MWMGLEMQLYFLPGEVVGGGHYYLMIKLDQTVPGLHPGIYRPQIGTADQPV